MRWVGFGQTVDIVRCLQLTDYLPDILVVGIGYRVDSIAAANLLRARDVSPTIDATITDEPTAMMSGAGRFLAFSREELKPWVRAQYQVHPTDDVYFGHSLGGLFGAYALLSEPASFRGYGLGSPSLWWDDCALFAQEQAYATAHTDLVADVFVGIGAYENALGDEIHRAWLRLGGAGEGRTEEPDPYDMVADMERLVERLRGRSYPGLRIGSAVLPREFHATAVPMNLSRSLRYLFRAPG